MLWKNQIYTTVHVSHKCDALVSYPSESGLVWHSLSVEYLGVIFGISRILNGCIKFHSFWDRSDLVTAVEDYKLIESKLLPWQQAER